VLSGHQSAVFWSGYSSNSDDIIEPCHCIDSLTRYTRKILIVLTAQKSRYGIQYFSTM
jgi:hypothetical protein